jgi:hypothetical protein
MDVFDEMIAREQFVEAIACGTSVVNAGIAVGWSPLHTRQLMKDHEFADIVRGAQDRANGTVEEALFNRAVAGNVAAMQMWLFNRDSDRWRDVKRIEVRSEHRVSIAAVESVKAGVLELLRDQGVGAMQALNSGDIIDGEVVDGSQD